MWDSFPVTPATVAFATFGLLLTLCPCTCCVLALQRVGMLSILLFVS
jgi:hypothetical protein